jgi:uncharacterized protein YjlB
MKKNEKPTPKQSPRNAHVAAGKVVRDYLLKGNLTFPNSTLPVLHYINVLKIPALLAGWQIKRQFAKNGWTNAWTAGIYTFHHYHSNTHEVLGVIKGETTICLGGDDGIKINVKKGDVVVIPAGVSHKNMGDENAVVCVGAYPHGANYNMNYGKPGERPAADHLIAKVAIPVKDPVFGSKKVLHEFWAPTKPEKPKPIKTRLEPKKSLKRIPPVPKRAI